jgi:hypothetical protein
MRRATLFLMVCCVPKVGQGTPQHGGVASAPASTCSCCCQLHWQSPSDKCKTCACANFPRLLLQRYVESEILNHSTLRHPHVVQFREVFLTKNNVSLQLLSVQQRPQTLLFPAQCYQAPNTSKNVAALVAWCFHKALSKLDLLGKAAACSCEMCTAAASCMPCTHSKAHRTMVRVSAAACADQHCDGLRIRRQLVHIRADAQQVAGAVGTVSSSSGTVLMRVGVEQPVTETTAATAAAAAAIDCRGRQMPSHHKVHDS